GQHPEEGLDEAHVDPALLGRVPQCEATPPGSLAVHLVLPAAQTKVHKLWTAGTGSTSPQHVLVIEGEGQRLCIRRRFHGFQVKVQLCVIIIVVGGGGQEVLRHHSKFSRKLQFDTVTLHQDTVTMTDLQATGPEDTQSVKLRHLVPWLSTWSSRQPRPRSTNSGPPEPGPPALRRFHGFQVKVQLCVIIIVVGGGGQEVLRH
ncbi:hypothetical protein CRUP_009356, partial [Coryphaenoides rupestris]